MRDALALLLVAALAIGAFPSVGAADSADSAQDVAADCAAFPPCGWINPQLSMELNNQPCPDDSAGEGCMAPPTEDAPVVFEGEFIMKWEVSEEGTYPADPSDPIEVTFHSTGSNPSFLDFHMEPSSFTYDSTAINNPANLQTKENSDGSDSVWYEIREEVTVTVTRSGDPTLDDIQRIERKDGEVQFLIRIHSDSSGSNYKDAYGLEAIYFHVGAATDDPAVEQIHSEIQGLADEQEAPVAPVPVIAMAVLAIAVVARRRH